MWGTLIALLKDGEPIIGVIDQPVLKERWVGVKGRPTMLNGRIAPVSGVLRILSNPLHLMCRHVLWQFAEVLVNHWAFQLSISEQHVGEAALDLCT